MATITANLNGGDLITPDNELTYKIYGSSDNYASPIATVGSANTDANVSVNAGVVTIENVDLGTENVFKMSSVDEAGNESELSDAISRVNIFTNEVLGLSLGYVGYGANIEVDLRRSSNDDVQTFTPAEIIDGTLITFCGSGSGFVTAWRDITNNISLVQTDTDAQPRLVNSGVLETNYGKPALYFDGVDDFLEENTFTLAQPFTAIAVQRIEGGGLFGSQGNDSDINVFSGGTEQLVGRAGSALVSTNNQIGLNENRIVSIIANGASSKLRFDAVENQTGDAGSGGLNGIFIGKAERNGTRFLTGYISEFRLFSVDESTNILNIEKTIAKFWYDLPASANIFLHGGQSNAEGRYSTDGSDGTGTPSYLTNNIVDGVKVYNGNVITDLDLSITSAFDIIEDVIRTGGSGRSVGDTPPGRSFENWAFADVAFKEINDSIGNVIVLGLSKGGTSLTSDWINNGGLLSELEDKYNKLISKFNAFQVPYNVRGMIWHQGERDGVTGQQAQYQASWTTFISRIRTLTGNANFPIFYGTISEDSEGGAYNTVVKAAQLDTAAGDANLYCRDNTDLTLFDTAHFDAASQLTFGQWTRQNYIDNY